MRHPLSEGKGRAGSADRRSSADNNRQAAAAWSQPWLLGSVQTSWDSPARLVLAPVEAGEELLLVSPAREVLLEWKVGVGRFNLLPVDGIILKKKN